MDTEEQQEPKKGNTRLVDKFSSSCSLPALVELAPETYPKELLSNRLSGSEIKEALLIAILNHVKEVNPEKEPPK